MAARALASRVLGWLAVLALVGVAMALATGGTPQLQPGRKFAVFANVGAFDGASALGVGGTALLYDTKRYSITANAAVGVGFNTGTAGGRAGFSFQW